MFIFLWILIENIKRDINKFKSFVIELNKTLRFWKAVEYAAINIFNKRTINNLIYPKEMVEDEGADVKEV